MTSKHIQYILRTVSIILAFVSVFSYFPVISTAAEEEVDPIVVVSLGDSFSSGEGIPPFFGQDLDVLKKVQNEDWLAHRSTVSWPSRLYVPGMPENTTLADYRVVVPGDVQPECQWYFGAVSGAVSKNIYETQQARPFYVKKPGERNSYYMSPEDDPPLMPLQIDIFDEIDEDVDYVTLTIGGNDVQFATIVEQAAHPKYSYSTLENTLNAIEANVATHETNVKKAYTQIYEATGGTAEIIVAGYPELFDKGGRGALISKKEATLINSKVVWFNELLEQWVTDKQNEGMPIHFVPVVPTFDSHQAYSQNAWLNSIMISAQAEDLDQRNASAYSIHPNTLGAAAYARLVNQKIAEIELNKRIGTLAGRICEASDRTTPVTDARITASSVLRTENTSPDSNGMYSMELPASRYYVTVRAEGYIPFKAYAVVKEDQIEYMQTFLMVQGEETDIGSAQGMITNALNGMGLSDVTLDVRSGWNNDSEGEILTTVTTDDYGAYLVTLPIGNYTLCANKDGFAPTMVNIIVQKTPSGNQDGTMTPVLSGDDYRIVLRWGVDPRDLDSHVVGTLSNGNSFHVYYGHKSQYDGSTEVCNLDYDDTTSYGPETITLNATGNKPYYYYIYKFAGNGTVAASGAQVKVYQGEREVATFNVPSNLGDGRYWNVFAIVDGQLVVRNTITSGAETSYAKSNTSTFSLRDPQAEEHPAYDDSYPAKEEVTIDVPDPTEDAPATTETPERPPVTSEDDGSDDNEASVPQAETRRVYLGLGQLCQQYTWKVEALDREYDVVEETEGIYYVELPVDAEMIIIRGKNQVHDITSEVISLDDAQGNNCIIALACEGDGSEFEIIWGIYDPETKTISFEVEEAPVNTEASDEQATDTDPAESSGSPAADETESAEETESNGPDVSEEVEDPEDSDTVS